MIRGSRKETRSRTTAQPSNTDVINEPDKLDDENDRKDCVDLLKPATNFHTSKTIMKHTNELRMRASKNKEESFKGMSDTLETGAAMQSSTAATPISLTDQLAKQKNKRRLNNTMGGPVMSSGLAVKRDARTRHSTGRLSNSLTANHIGSLFGDEEESRERSVLQTEKWDALDDKVHVRVRVVM